MSSNNEESTDTSIDGAKSMTAPVQVEVSEHPVGFFIISRNSRSSAGRVCDLP